MTDTATTAPTASEPPPASTPPAAVNPPLILSASLSPGSRSRVLARTAADSLRRQGIEPTVVDLAEQSLPLCDGATAYGAEGVGEMAEQIRTAGGILCATPIYNYDVNAALKNVVELTGKAWTGQVVGFLAAAGGSGSYMSLMGLANSLMLDFRCLIVPRFVYATGEHFQGDEVGDTDIVERIDELASTVTQLATAWGRLGAGR